MWRTCCRSYITVGTTFKISATNNDSKAHQLHKIMTNTHWDWGHAEKYKPFSHITCSSLTTTERDVDNKGRKIFYIKSFSQYAALTVLSKSQIKQSKCGRWEANLPTTACQHQQTSLRFWSTWVGSFISTLRAFNRPRKHNMCFKLKREESGKSTERQGHMGFTRLWRKQRHLQAILGQSTLFKRCFCHMFLRLNLVSRMKTEWGKRNNVKFLSFSPTSCLSVAAAMRNEDKEKQMRS